MPRAHNHPRDAQAVHDAIHAIVTKIMRNTPARNMRTIRCNVERIFARTMTAAKNLFALAWLAVACILEAFPAGAEITDTVIAYVTAVHRIRPARHVFYTMFTALTRMWSHMTVVCSLH